MKKNSYLIFTVILCFIALGYFLYTYKNRYVSEINTSVKSLPNPPDSDSYLGRHDEEMYQKGIALRKTERGKEALRHAGINKLDKLESYFSSFVGQVISRESTPKTHALLEEVLYISRKTAGKAKKKFNRPRPFVAHPEDPTCLPDSKASSNPYGSYPSFHAATAWGFGLMLAKIVPDKSSTILNQTHRLSDSRWICGYHWASDVLAAETMVEDIIGRLMQNNDFQHRVAEAQKEWLSVPKK